MVIIGSTSPIPRVIGHLYMHVVWFELLATLAPRYPWPEWGINGEDFNQPLCESHHHRWTCQEWQSSFRIQFNSSNFWSHLTDLCLAESHHDHWTLILDSPVQNSADNSSNVTYGHIQLTCASLNQIIEPGHSSIFFDIPASVEHFKLNFW